MSTPTSAQQLYERERCTYASNSGIILFTCSGGNFYKLTTEWLSITAGSECKCKWGENGSEPKKKSSQREGAFNLTVEDPFGSP